MTLGASSCPDLVGVPGPPLLPGSANPPIKG